MEVSIPLIQNQVIDHTGTYRIVQRTVNGQTGLVIEEYIPEPEPEEVLQNNSNTRAMIIDEDENNNENNEENNNNNGQMVLRGQNNVRGGDDPTPAGEAIEGTFEINITPTPSKINIKYVSINNNEIEIKNNFTYTNISTNINIPRYSLLIYIIDYDYLGFYNVRMEYNNSSNTNTSIPSSSYYYIANINDSQLKLLDENRNLVLSLYEEIANDNIYTHCSIYKNFFNIILN